MSPGTSGSVRSKATAPVPMSVWLLASTVVTWKVCCEPSSTIGAAPLQPCVIVSARRGGDGDRDLVDDLAGGVDELHLRLAGRERGEAEVEAVRTAERDGGDRRVRRTHLGEAVAVGQRDAHVGVGAGGGHGVVGDRAVEQAVGPGERRVAELPFGALKQPAEHRRDGGEQSGDEEAEACAWLR